MANLRTHPGSDRRLQAANRDLRQAVARNRTTPRAADVYSSLGLMTYLPLILRLFLALVVLTAGVCDIRYRRIPNWLVLPGLLFGLLLNVFLFRWEGLSNSALGAGLALLIYVPLYLLRGMGAGDVKLMAAVGAIVGYGNWFTIFVITGILGGILALLLVVARGRLKKTLWNTGYVVSEMLHLRAPHAGNEELDVRNPKAMRLPHGAVIALGSLAFLGMLAVGA